MSILFAFLFWCEKQQPVVRRKITLEKIFSQMFVVFCEVRERKEEKSD
jgi:hypothetical protein